jgi:hypothetical protein
MIMNPDARHRRSFQLRTLWVVTLCFPATVRHSACQLLGVLTSRKQWGTNIVKRDNEIVALISQRQFGLPACNPNTCLREVVDRRR